MIAALNCRSSQSAGVPDPAQRVVGHGRLAIRRHRAASMQLAAELDRQYVELHILSDYGESIAVTCPRNSIFALQQHIEQVGRQCPGIAGLSHSIALSAVR